MAVLEMSGVCKSYGDYDQRTSVLQDINLSVEEGEFVALLGFSGSGKTTLMQILAGIIAADAGEVRASGELVDGPDPSRGLVFQNYSLLPWLTVLGNIRLGVDKAFPEMSAKDRKSHAMKYVEMVNLTSAAEKKPHELSGGMRQRVSLARTLAMCPKILLLDEPLSALDALTRSVLQDEISRIWSQERTTMLMVTNDIDEAILMADRIVPLKPGPGASLGPCFDVQLARPRVARDLNHDPEFIRLRNRVTHYLTEVRAEATKVADACQPQKELARPMAAPIDLTPRGAIVG